jgi:2-polyprenyl-6-methoxyphenol hydroxylase-like FAD-dependent oxidoreductase
VGWDVRIFEQASTPRELGFGVALAANAVAALTELGVADTVLPHGTTPSSGEIRRTDGRLLRRMVGRADDIPTGRRPCVVMRSVLHGALLDALDPGVVETNHRAMRFDAEGSRVRLGFATGTSATGDIVVAADGVGSTIRSQLHPAEPPPRPSGYFAIRGASPALKRMDGLDALWYLGPGVESGIVKAGHDRIYWFLSILATEIGAGPMETKSVLDRVTASYDPRFHALTDPTAPGDMRLDELFARPPLASWGSGRVTLLGDAAHPMLPHTGQGAAQAMEDAVGLARALCAGGSDVVGALRRYEDVRARRTRRVVDSGPRIARITTTVHPVLTFLRNMAIRVMPEAALLKPFAHTDPDPHAEIGPAQGH